MWDVHFNEQSVCDALAVMSRGHTECGPRV